jgi:hypothetical protein
MDVNIHGAPTIHVLYQEVGLRSRSLIVSEGGLQPASVGRNPVHTSVRKVEPPLLFTAASTGGCPCAFLQETDRSPHFRSRLTLTFRLRSGATERSRPSIERILRLVVVAPSPPPQHETRRSCER